MNKIVFKYCKKCLIPLLILILFSLFIILLIQISSFTEYFRKVPQVDSFCTNLFAFRPNRTLLEDAKRWTPSVNETYTDSQLLKAIKLSCDNFLRKQQYFLDLPKTPEEKSMPIAFTILTFKSASQVERLLRMIYRPWNSYCIHVDQKSDYEFFNAMEELVKCLDDKYHNIINTKNRVDVRWGKMTVLTADLNCMKELYERYKDWKYLINLTGQEFPLKTNAELARILIAYKGANNVEGLYRLRRENRLPSGRMPFPMVWYKGSVHISINRDFVKFIFESPISKVILDTIKDLLIPDETFFATLNFNSQWRIPGSFVGDPEDPNIPILTRFKNWGAYSCASKRWIREICIWGVGDLPKLVRAPHLFTNKFHEDFQPATLRCLEIWYYSKITKEIETGQIAINSSSYSSLPFVKYRYIPPIE